MVTADQIQELLDNGYTVRSTAAGRMGDIIGTVNKDVMLHTKYGRGLSRFDKGDPVKLEYSVETSEYVIKNSSNME